MEEKIIIKSERKDVRPFCIGLVIASAIFFVIYYIMRYKKYVAHMKYMFEKYGEKYAYTFGEALARPFRADGAMIFILLIVPVVAVIAYFLYKGWSQIELTVSDKRVYGTAAFGKRVDLPFDSISAVGTSAFNGIAITTASGAIKFVMIKNRDEIHSAVSKLLVERQSKEKPVATTTIKQEIPQSNADELKKYKELLDSGVISQEEFDAKKKQLLGL